jgi:hypothetical protein
MQKPIICAPAIGLFLLIASAFNGRAQIGTALSFDGTNDFVLPSANPFANVTNTFTIEAWVKPAAARAVTTETNTGISGTTSQRYAVFPDQGDAAYGAGHAGAGVSVGTNGISVFEHAANYLPSPLVYANSSTGWMHVAVVYSNRQPQLYLNGVLARTGLASTKIVHPSANLGEMGSVGSGYGYFSGQLDEFRVWNVARGAGEIRSNMFTVLSGAEPGLVVNYHFNEGTGGSTADSAALNGNTTGNLSNGVAWVTSSAPAAGLAVTMADSLLIDTNGNGKASAGDTIRYTITIQNSGTNTLTNVVLNVPATANNTLVPGSVKVPPKGVDDGPASNSVPGNAFHVALNTTFNLSAPGLLSNDSGSPVAVASFGGGSFPGASTTTAAGSSATNANVGTLTVNANGSVVFTPTATFNGFATFQYRLTNSLGSGLANVTIAVGTRPQASNDVYLVTGNTMIDTTLGGFSLSGALANDSGSGIRISANTTPASGTLALIPENGHFTYVPAPGFVGTTTFNYTITNGFGPASGTVTLNVSNLLWYVDNSVTVNGDGRSSSPFRQTSDFTAVNDGGAGHPANNDLIFLRRGGGNYTSTVNLRAGQRLIGDGATGTFASVFGFGLAPGSAWGPGALVPPLAGLRPVIVTTSGAGVNLGNGNLVRDLNLHAANGRGITGTNVGALTISNVVARAAGGAVLDLSSGAANIILDSASSTNSTAQGINLSNITGTVTLNAGTILNAGGAAFNVVGGTVTVTYNGAISQSSNAPIVAVTNHATGTLTFQTGALNASNGTGLQFDNADGTYNFLGTVTLNGGDAGIDIVNGSGGNFTFNNAPISGPTGIAFRVNGGGGSISHRGAIAKNNAGVAVDIQGRTGGSVTLHSNITASAGAGGIQVQNCTGGTITFAGPTKSLSTGVNPGVNLVNNTGTTINFTGGGLGITTSSGTGFNATGGGTVSVTTGANNNTVTTTTGVGVNIVNTTIGSAGATFRSISATNGMNGIALTSTGNGFFTVTGDGSLTRNGSGGTIQGTLDDGVALTSANNVTLQSMNFVNCGNTIPTSAAEISSTTGDQTIQISGGANIVLSAVLIQNPTGSGMVVLNLGGTNRITNSLFTAFADGIRHGIYVNNVNVDMGLFEFRNSTINNLLNDAATFFFANGGNSNMRLDVKGSTFENLDNQALTVAAGGTITASGTMTSTIGGPNPADRNFFRNARHFSVGGVNVSAENNLGILVNNGATHNSTVENNLFDNIAEDGTIANTSVLRTQNSGGRLNVIVRSNVIQNINFQTGAGGRHIIGHVFEPVVFSASDFSNLTFDGNTASNVTYTLTSREFIFVDYRPTASGGSVRAINNNFNMPTAGSQQAIELRFRQTNPSTVNVLVGTNGMGPLGAVINTALSFLDIDAEAAATVNASVFNNRFTNSNPTPGAGISVASETVGTSTMCANISGNNLSAAGNVIDINQTGTLRITQASAAAIQTANGGAIVSVTGSPLFGQLACTVP